MCRLLTTADRRAKKEIKFGILGPRNWICRVLFMSHSLSSVRGHSVQFTKFLMLIFKRPLLPHFSSKFKQILQKSCNRGKYTGYYFFWQDPDEFFPCGLPIAAEGQPEETCQMLKVYLKIFEDTMKTTYLSYIAIIDKAMLVSSGKRSSRVSRPLAFVFG